jgi:hypothetical protein
MRANYAREARESIAFMRAKRAKVLLVSVRSALKYCLYAREARESIVWAREARKIIANMLAKVLLLCARCARKYCYWSHAQHSKAQVCEKGKY